MPHTVYFRGIEDWPDINMRNEPGLINTVILFRIPKGKRAICHETQPDPNGDNFEGQVYQWFNLTLDNGSSGWVRDDLLDIEGDCRSFGYKFYSTRTYAFNATTQLLANEEDGPGIDSPPIFDGTEICSAVVRSDIAANIRFEPTINSLRLATLSPKTDIKIFGVQDGIDDNYRWVKMGWNHIFGYIREDLLVYSANCASLNLDNDNQPDPMPDINDSSSNKFRFESPVRGPYIVFQEFIGDHNGVDLSGATGLRIVAGGEGVVSRVIHCTKCTANKPSSVLQGHKLWDKAVINDPAWGWGYGNFVVVKYEWDKLPATMQTHLISIGLSGVFAYVIYAHLSSIDVAINMPVSEGTLLGRLGNTGNSTGPHLHLEVAISTKDNLVSLYNELKIDPRHMFVL